MSASVASLLHALDATRSSFIWKGAGSIEESFPSIPPAFIFDGCKVEMLVFGHLEHKKNGGLYSLIDKIENLNDNDLGDQSSLSRDCLHDLSRSSLREVKEDEQT